LSLKLVYHKMLDLVNRKYFNLDLWQVQIDS
jgi:hypothetical protein